MKRLAIASFRPSNKTKQKSKGILMSETKLSLQEILEEINLHEATEDNRQIAAVIVTEIFRKPELKGKLNGNCNVKSCQKPGATYFNHSTLKYYCKNCADRINKEGRETAFKMFGHDLCILEEIFKEKENCV
jgi:hypothetical protein